MEWTIVPEFFLLLYFFYVVFYTFIFSIAGLFYKNPVSRDGIQKKIAVFIPAYKEDGVIIDVAQHALKQSYPSHLYRVIIIADSLRNNTMEVLRKLPLDVIEVNFETSTKVKSLNFALQNVNENYDYALILDADNIMLPDFIKKVNGIHLGGAQVVQGQRIPKNTDNSLSLLDGLSEAINNHIYRQGTTALGLSASISGSGVSFPYSKFKELISGMNSIGGFDRELELLFLKSNMSVVYSKQAKVMDEKVQKTDVFENQRRRWISSQYFYLRKYWSTGVRALFEGNFTFFNSAVLRNIQLPRLINIGLLTLLTALLFFVRNYLSFGYTVWIFLFCVHTVAILLAIPSEYYTKKLVLAVVRLPLIFINMMLLLFKLKGANKKFIHTPHGVGGNK
jgi:cellulose synthase/poly-beta-1,6-N-acetylglucosamine synthase-like glycosyltransferase